MILKVAMLLALAPTATHLTVQPWTGSDLQATNAQAAKYRLEVKGKPNTVVRLEASGIASGWLAAFCTAKICSPQRIELRLPGSGSAIFQFELIRESESAPKESGATIKGDDGAFVMVPAALRQ